MCIAEKLNRKCPNRIGYWVHRHVILESGRTRAAQVYLDDLCKAICEGLQEQLKLDEKGQFLLMNANTMDGGCTNGASSKELHESVENLRKKYMIVEEDDTEALETVWDDVSGATLDPKRVREARQDEMAYVHKMRLYDKVPIE